MQCLPYTVAGLTQGEGRSSQQFWPQLMNWRQFFHVSVLLLIVKRVITLSKRRGSTRRFATAKRKFCPRNFCSRNLSFYVSVLLSIMKISQSESEKLISYCKTVDCLWLYRAVSWTGSVGSRVNPIMCSASFYDLYVSNQDFPWVVYLTIIPRARMGYESIAHEAEGRMGYWLMAHEGKRNNCFSKIKLVRQK